jgi:hypothetical protein
LFPLIGGGQVFVALKTLRNSKPKTNIYKMNRVLLFIDRNGVRASYGTMLILDDGTCITSNPLSEQIGVRYFVSFSGSSEDVEPLNAISEVLIPPPGMAVHSIAPYIYQVTDVGRK